MTIPEFTPAEALARMRDDAQKIEDVAEMVSANRQAFAMLAKHVSPVCPSDEAAAQLAHIMYRMLLAFAHDMREAVEQVEAGECEMQAAVVRVVDVPDEGETKH